MTATTGSTVKVLITAEDAPVGVQLWPTTHPRYARNYTLESVEVVRRTIRDFHGTTTVDQVVWNYENGQERTFRLGERVAAEVTAADATAHNLTNEW